MAQHDFVNGLIGSGVVVKEMERSLDFYINVIGMTRTGGFDVDENFGKLSGLTGGIPFHVEILKLQDNPGASNWKLISFNREGSHPLPAHIQDDTGVQYITIHVTSLEPILTRIREHQVELLGETPVPLDTDRHFVLVQDPDGTFIELIGPMQ